MWAKNTKVLRKKTMAANFTIKRQKLSKYVEVDFKENFKEMFFGELKKEISMFFCWENL